MDTFESALNDLLVNTFHSILKLEEQSLQHISSSRLSLNELHLLEAIAKGHAAGRSITDIAKELSITLPSVTMAVNKLTKKGYVLKNKSEGDKRLVIVQLSPEGRRAEASHRYFHRHMVNSASEGLSPQERDALLKGLVKLHAFFRSHQPTSEQFIPKAAIIAEELSD